MSGLVRTARGTDPRDVARACAEAAELALQRTDARFWAMRAVGAHVPGATEALYRSRVHFLEDLPEGAWFVAALGDFARSVAPLREPSRFGEIVSAPWRTIAYRAGDCDDVAAAVAMCAAVVGLPAAVAVYYTAPGFAHCVALVGNDWHGERGPVLQVDQNGLAPFAPTSQPYIVTVSTKGKPRLA